MNVTVAPGRAGRGTLPASLLMNGQTWIPMPEVAAAFATTDHGWLIEMDTNKHVPLLWPDWWPADASLDHIQQHTSTGSFMAYTLLPLWDEAPEMSAPASNDEAPSKVTPVDDLPLRPEDLYDDEEPPYLDWDDEPAVEAAVPEPDPTPVRTVAIARPPNAEPTTYRMTGSAIQAADNPILLNLLKMGGHK